MYAISNNHVYVHKHPVCVCKNAVCLGMYVGFDMVNDACFATGPLCTNKVGL